MNKKKFYARLRVILIIILILVVGIIGELVVISFRKNRYDGNLPSTQDRLIQDDNAEVIAENSESNDKDQNDLDQNNQNQNPQNQSEDDQKSNDPSTKEQMDETDDDGADHNQQDINEIVMVFMGDIYLSDYVINQYNKHGVDGILSKSIQEEFQNAHIVMANEEFPFSNRGTKAEDKQFTFRIDPKYVQIFKDMMINIVTLGNNHVLDYGIPALQDTFDTLNSAEIQYVGAGNNITEARETKYIKVGEKNIAILGASRVIPVTEWNATEKRPGLFTTYDPTALIAEIQAAKTQSDYVIVYVHWGIERKNQPEEYQRKMAKQYIDAGADLVVGSHPHVLQGMEYYKDKPIIYSLGNFMFYSSIPQTALLKVTFQTDTSVRVELLPAKAENGTTFIIENSKEKQKFYEYMTSISYDVTFDERGIVSY